MKKYHIHTYGCQMNVRDSEAVGALLERRGFERAADEDERFLLFRAKNIVYATGGPAGKK